MSSVRLRPTFTLRTGKSKSVVIREIQNAIAENEDFRGQFAGRHVVVSIVESKRHFWSPWLNIEANDSDQGCEVMGRFSPHPNIWTAFMFSYLALAVLGFFAVIFGISQQLLGQTPWSYFFLPVLLLIGMLLWAASQTGQKLANSEMSELKMMIAGCLSDSLSNDSSSSELNSSG